MRVRVGRLALVSLALAVGAIATGCAQPRTVIDRRQPDALDKTNFIPVQYSELTSGATPETLTSALVAREPAFYTQTTLISKPTTTGFMGLTFYSEAQKIRFEVTQNFLIARHSYEFVHGAPHGTGGIAQNPQSGSIEAVFRISSHFDVRHEYSPITGEELNIVGENSTDRPWYQRRFMRVDWSQNLIEGYNSPLRYEEWRGVVRSEPVPVFVNNPQDPLAPVFVYGQRSGEATGPLEYFDVVNRAILHPETTMLGEAYPNVPICILGDGETDCAPAEVTFRVAFRRVDEERDYEPASLTVPLPGMSNPPAYLDQERFGFFESGRVGFDPVQSATLDSQRIHFANRHNIWLHHHALRFGPDTTTLCNADADCNDVKMACRIANTARDPEHRGVCAPLAIHHLPTGELACVTNADCRAPRTGVGVSHTAVCDEVSHTCGEHYVRCARTSDCTTIDPQSTCDLAIAYTRPDNRGLCLMPYRQRQVRQIAYHESTGYPEHMQPVTESIVRNWNDAFRTAVVAARRHECEIEQRVDPATTSLAANPCNDPQVTGMSDTLGSDARFPFVGCHSPVWGTGPGAGNHTQAEVTATHDAGWDLPVCGPQGTNARIGDMRYSMIGAITDHDAQGYWGLGNIAGDPETGEMIVGRGAVWQTITDTQAAFMTDMVRLLNDDLSPDEIANGTAVLTSMRQLGTGQTIASQVIDSQYRQENGLARLAGVRTGLDALQLPDAGWLTPESRIPLFSRDPERPGAFDIAARRISQSRLLGDGSHAGQARLMSLRGSSLEDRMMNQQQIRLAPTARADDNALTPSTRDAASPLRTQSLAFQRFLGTMRTQLSEQQCNFEAASVDDVVLGLARRLAEARPLNHNDPAEADVAFGRDWNFRNPDSTVNYDLVRVYAANFLQHGVLAHEIGHSIGQRHNFNASNDAVNFDDRYWRVRGQGHPSGLRPRYEYLADPADGHYYSEAEINGRIEEYSYTSVMDYRSFNEDGHGLGRYDYAFVAGGYTNTVQAFRSVADPGGALMYGVNTMGSGISTSLDLRAWSTGGRLHGMHYTQIPQLFGTVSASDPRPNVGDDNRYWVFLNETRSRDVPGWGSPSFSNVTADGHVLVPYAFDSDNRAGLVWRDQRYDAGADAFESLHYVTERYLNYYFAASYSHLRSGFSTLKYWNRMMGRYLRQIHQTTQTLAFDLTNFADFFATANGWREYRNDPSERGGFINQAVMAMTADTLVAQLTMPEMGTHEERAQLDNTQLIFAGGSGTETINIPINEGRAFESNWRQDTGFWWYEHLNRAGSYYDKVMSLEVLTDPELHLLNRDTSSDYRQFQLSYYTMFPDQMIRLFGGLLSEDYQDFAPLMQFRGDNRTIDRTHVATINLPPGVGPGQSGRRVDSANVPIDPQTHFTIQLWAAIHTISQFPATFDQRYMDYARLWIDGSTESIVVTDPDVNTVSFTDPWTHQTFRALHFGTALGQAGYNIGPSAYVHASTGAVADEAGIAARMLLHIRDLDTLRLRASGNGDLMRATQLENEERRYVDLLHVVRLLTRYFGTGHITIPDPPR